VILTLACGRYDRTEGLLQGRVPIDGFPYVAVSLPAEDMFRRAIQRAEFDITELSAGSHLVQLGQGDPSYVALPIFPSRSFRLNAIYIRTDRGISTPSDLVGRRMGVPEFAMTAAVWLRGILAEHYDLDIHSIRYVTGGLNSPGLPSRQTLPDLPFSIVRITENETLDSLLRAGDLDAVMAPSPPASFFDASVPVARLFADPAAEEKRFFDKTGIFPIMHFVGLRRSLAEGHEDLDLAIETAFAEAKDEAMARLSRLSRDNAAWLTMPWLEDAWRETLSAMGDDFWPYGIEKNRRTLEALCRYTYQQGLTPTLIDLEDLFPFSARPPPHEV
jgi:4,5-dihydroxyphthalate decarboxylase